MKERDALKRLRDLQRMAQLQLDLGLSDLRRAANAKAGSEAQLAALAERRSAAGLDPVAAALAEARWQIWAEARRVQVNLILARQSAVWSQARDDARRDFARCEALRLLVAKRHQSS